MDYPEQKKLVRGPTADPDSGRVALPKFAGVREEVSSVIEVLPFITDPFPKRLAKRSPLVQGLYAGERSNRKDVMLNKDRLPAASERKE